MKETSIRSQNSTSCDITPAPPLNKIVPQGRPRDEKAHQAIMATALQMALTKNRYRDITIENIAEEAKVAKTTIYRWWDSKSDLIHEACFAGQLHDPAPCSMKAELRDLLNQAYQMHISRATRGVMAGLLADYIEYSQENAESIFPFERDLNNILTLICNRGQARGDCELDCNIRAMAKTIEMTLFNNCITYGQTCNDEQINILMQQVIAAASLPQWNA
ncbi:MAG: AcrR family transcriptional regulator [Planctomycetota bacterium]|jgi:AcrR family transcriptional regulator